MRRDLVHWTFALGVAFIVILSFTPAFGYSASELLGERNVSVDCNEKTRVCTVPQDDMEWIINRDRLMHSLLERAGAQLHRCGVKGV